MVIREPWRYIIKHFFLGGVMVFQGMVDIYKDFLMWSNGIPLGLTIRTCCWSASTAVVSWTAEMLSGGAQIKNIYTSCDITTGILWV